MLDVSPRLELVIFDCDGVLVDSESIAADLEVEMFAEIKNGRSPDLCRSMKATASRAKASVR